MRIAGSIIAAVAMLAPGLCQAQPATAGESASGARLLASGCSGCHGTDGRAQIGGSKLAGLQEAYIAAQIKAFRSGERPATVMHQVAKGYDDIEIAALARYFSAQPR